VERDIPAKALSRNEAEKMAIFDLRLNMAIFTRPFITALKSRFN
jgi:hypothetical protein